MVTDGQNCSLCVKSVPIRSHENSDVKLQCNQDRISGNVGRQNFSHRLKTDLVFRHKILLSLALFWLSIVLGWNVSQLGPALWDLMIITSSKLDEASYFFTTLSLGFLFGASITGWILKKINPMIVISVLNTFFSIVTVVQPWCTHYGLMIVLFLIRGTTRGIVDAACNILIMETWGAENGPYMQTLHFVFAIGGILSPLATASFLSDSKLKDSIKNVNNTCIKNDNYTYSIYMITTESPENLTLNSSVIFGSNNISALNYPQSTVHGAFVISGILAVSASPLFLYFLFSVKKKDAAKHDNVVRINRNTPRVMKNITLTVVCTAVLFYLIIEKSMVFFLPSFVVEHLLWTTVLGSYTSTVYWTAFALGRFIGIFITRRFRTRKIVLIYVNLLTLSSVGLMVTSLLKIDVGIWIFIPLSGFSQSIFYPIMLTWMEEDFFKVSGKIVSLVMFIGSVGTMITPVILGYLMDLYTPMWLTYSHVMSSIILLVLCFVLLFLSRKFKNSAHEDELFVDVPKET